MSYLKLIMLFSINFFGVNHEGMLGMFQYGQLDRFKQ